VAAKALRVVTGPFQFMKSIAARAAYALLEQTSVADWKRLAKETELEFAWIRAFALGNISDPSSSRLEKLNMALTGKPFPHV
jgi:purine-cytosine permease-like protein